MLVIGSSNETKVCALLKAGYSVFTLSKEGDLILNSHSLDYMFSSIYLNK